MMRFLSLFILLTGCVVPIGPAPKGAEAPPAASGSWQRVQSRLTSTLHDVQLIGNAGFAVGDDGVLLKTSDGLAWGRFDPPALAGKALRTIAMLDAAEGVVTTDKAVLKTADGGATWKLLLDLDAAFHDAPVRARFADARRGWVVGRAGLYRTDDGGATWRVEGPALGTHETRPGDVRQVDGAAWAWGGGALYKHAPGLGWALMLDPAEKDAERCMGCPAAAAFPPGGEAWFFGGPEGRLYRSADAGRTWASVPFVDRAGDAVTPGGTLPRDRNPALVAFPDARHGWVLAANTLLATEDGGKSWARYETPPVDGPDARAKQLFPADIRALWMTSATSGWAVGHGGLVARFTKP